MDKESGHPGAERLTGGSPSYRETAHRTPLSVPTGQQDLYEEVDRLRLEVERLRDQQQALQRNPTSNDTHVDDDLEDEAGDKPDPGIPVGRARARHRRPVKLILALLLAAILSAGGPRFWHYIESYESTAPASIAGQLRPASHPLRQT